MISKDFIRNSRNGEISKQEIKTELETTRLEIMKQRLETAKIAFKETTLGYKFVCDNFLGIDFWELEQKLKKELLKKRLGTMGF
jgi:hypothetical protein